MHRPDSGVAATEVALRAKKYPCRACGETTCSNKAVYCHTCFNLYPDIRCNACLQPTPSHSPQNPPHPPAQELQLDPLAATILPENLQIENSCKGCFAEFGETSAVLDCRPCESFLALALGQSSSRLDESAIDRICPNACKKIATWLLCSLNRKNG